MPRLSLASLPSLAIAVVVASTARAAFTPPSAWRDREAGYFAAAMIDAGVLFFRPRTSLGYGRAHAQWVGFDLNPIISGEGLGTYGGLRLAAPWINLRAGARFRHTFRRAFLLPKDQYEREDIEIVSGPKSRYVSLEGELTLTPELGPGQLISETAVTATLGVDPGHYVYEETIRMVLDPPWTWRSRLGYVLHLPPGRRFSAGVAAEIVHNPGRKVVVFRAGIIARFIVRENLELRGTFIPALASPDNLGAAGGDTFQLGLRYRWAYRFR